MFGLGATSFLLTEPGMLATELPGGAPLQFGQGVPLRNGPLGLQVTRIGLGDVLLQIARSTPIAMLGTLSRDMVVLMLPRGGAGSVLLNGRPVAPRCVAAYGAGVAYEVSSPVDCAWVMIVLTTGLAKTFLGRRALPGILAPGTHATLNASPAAWARAETLAQNAADVAKQDPGVFDVEHTRRALHSEMLETADELLAFPADCEAVQTRNARAAHRRLVRQADGMVTAAPDRMVGVLELSSTLGISERQLRNAFRGVLGVGPSRYLKLRRLVLVRAALLSPALPWLSVREAALAHGFRHLGRFASLYRNAFGEVPSATLEATLARRSSPAQDGLSRLDPASDGTAEAGACFRY